MGKLALSTPLDRNTPPGTPAARSGISEVDIQLPCMTGAILISAHDETAVIICKSKGEADKGLLGGK